MRLLLLCNNYHPLSVACLQSLHAAGRFEISVGLVRQKEGGIGGSGLKMLRRYGIAETGRRGMRFAIAAARINTRKLGIKLNGYRSVHEFLQSHPLNQLYRGNFKGHEAVNAVRGCAFDLIVAAGFSQILASELLQIPLLGALNVHLSLLPKYRGPSACYWVVKNKEKKTGVTVHFMDAGIDAGDIAAQREVPVGPRESWPKLERRLAAIGAELLLETIGQVESGTVRRLPQRHEEATYYSFPRPTTRFHSALRRP